MADDLYVQLDRRVDKVEASVGELNGQLKLLVGLCKLIIGVVPASAAAVVGGNAWVQSNRPDAVYLPQQPPQQQPPYPYPSIPPRP